MAASQSSDALYGDNDEEFEEQLQNFSLSNPTKSTIPAKRPRSPSPEPEQQYGVSKEGVRSALRKVDDSNDVYGAATFGGFGQYMSRKRAKLQIQNQEIYEKQTQIFKGVEIYVSPACVWLQLRWTQ